MTDTHYLTKDGLKKLKDELHKLKTEERPNVSARIEAAIAMGDLSENAEYDDAKNQQAFIESRIAEIETILKNVSLIDDVKQKKNTVSLGSKVKVKFNGNEAEFTIVGSQEADPTKGMISHESPLGKALLEKKKGDKVEVEVNAGPIEYEIASIS